MMDSIIAEVEADPHYRKATDAAHPEPEATISDVICHVTAAGGVDPAGQGDRDLHHVGQDHAASGARAPGRPDSVPDPGPRHGPPDGAGLGYLCDANARGRASSTRSSSRPRSPPAAAGFGPAWRTDRHRRRHAVRRRRHHQPAQDRAAARRSRPERRRAYAACFSSSSDQITRQRRDQTVDVGVGVQRRGRDAQALGAARHGRVVDRLRRRCRSCSSRMSLIRLQRTGSPTITGTMWLAFGRCGMPSRVEPARAPWRPAPAGARARPRSPSGGGCWRARRRPGPAAARW